MICHYCRQPLARHEAHDLRVMRPVHKACHVARLAEPPTKHLQIKRMPLPASVARTLPRWGRGAMILAVDPGPVESAYVRLEAGRVAEAAKVPNGEILRIVEGWRHWPLAVEMIASYGMPVGAEVFETCVFIGRIWQAYGREPIRVRRIQVKSHLCHSARANDASVRQALLDRWGGKGTAIGRKAAPGPLYGVHGDAWAALAVAVTVSDGGHEQ